MLVFEGAFWLQKGAEAILPFLFTVILKVLDWYQFQFYFISHYFRGEKFCHGKNSNGRSERPVLQNKR
jgi:hypothetical protein